MMIGDSCLQKRGQSTSLHVEQKDESFVIHIWNLFDSIGIVGAKASTRSRLNKRTGKTYSAYQFATFTLPFFTTLFNHWYHNVEGKNVKVLPSNIAELLTPVALAFWLSSDGSYQKDNGVVILCTDSFTADEVDL
jgi:hypothetical protein